ncbi:Mu transposase C-terminal domain-containing protein [Methylorubrum aminovorans]|uniref:Mu transposase C-terminal domain-containing protein n=1 Tax=Methylorubrum aminovorans TaxID=269069 RepID=UPI003C2CC37A
MDRPAFLRLTPSSQVRSGSGTYRITHEIDLDSVLAVDIATGEPKRLHVHEIEAVVPETSGDGDASATEAAPGKACGDYTDAQWSEAQRRYGFIKPLIDHSLPSKEQIAEVAKRAGVSVSTIYRWRSLFSHSEHVSSLVPGQDGRPVGTRLISPEQEEIIRASIEDRFLQTQKFKPSDVVVLVIDRCKAAGLKPPAAGTVRDRIAELHPALVLRRRGERAKARDTYEPIRGSFPGADTPLAVVQIDHTLLDVIAVEETTRKAMGRPWLTLAIDVYSRMVVGLYLSMERPNANAVGLCLTMAMLPKDAYLRRLDVPGSWPVWGRMAKLLCDNAKEFRGKMLSRACREWGIDPEFRPVKLPHYGGHIERLMGTVANEIRTLDGATFSNPKERGSYDSEGQASQTLEEIERHLVDFFVTGYHERFHHGIDGSPKQRWRLGIQGDGSKPGTGLPDLITDTQKLRLDFTPAEERTIQEYGVALDHVQYYDEVLRRWINARDPDQPKLARKFLFRRDPRDISRIWFFDPEIQRYYPIPYRNVSRPAVSLWEIRAAKAELIRDGRSKIDERTLMEGALRRRSLAEDAREKTKTARREHHRATRLAARTNGDAPMEPAVTPRPAPARSTSLDDIFAEPPPVFTIRPNTNVR